MSFEERVAAVWDIGTYIGDRPEGQLFVQLYNMVTFYAEIYYNPEINEVIKVRGFKTTRLVEPYLRGIRISF